MSERRGCVQIARTVIAVKHRAVRGGEDGHRLTTDEVERPAVVKPAWIATR